MVAGGNWQIFAEILDSRAIRQQDSLSCGAACGEMLLKERGINLDTARHQMGSEVVAKVLAIEEKTSDTLQVAMSWGNERYEFIFKIETDGIDPKFKSLLEDRQFSQLFKFNAPISSQVLRLIAQVINGEKVEFPVEVGEFYTPEQALSQQKTFKAELVLEKFP